MHFFTSINNNYMPKARVLAHSIRKHCKDVYFTLVLSDKIMDNFQIENEPFDRILTVNDLDIPVKSLNQWIFEHTVVELCTAVKGQALVKLLEDGAEKVVYLDPDIVAFDSLEQIEAWLDEYDFLLTPHQTIAEKTKQDIMNNEICSMMHGIYNFGFFAANNSENGLAIARWWRDRLLDFCFDDIPNGLFTDQRWGDLIPALFDNYYIIKDPGCNVSTWNLTTRDVTKKDDHYYVNGSPLKFYHFSGFDSGAQEAMLNLNGGGNPYLFELREWYIRACDDAGQQALKSLPSIYNFFDNGERIIPYYRKIIRSREDVRAYFADVDLFNTEQPKSYYLWCQDEMIRLGISPQMANDPRWDNQCYRMLNTQYDEIVNSRAWKFIEKYRSIKIRLMKRG